jgi:beta-glucanase (GH16 family)
MYPFRSPQKTVPTILSVGLLVSVFLIVWKSEIRSAQAYFPRINADENKASGELALLAVSSASGSASAVDVRVSSADDDAEQRLSDGYMYLDSSDLELINDPGVAKDNQSVGIRFAGVAVPRGATVTRAYLELQVDESSSENTSLVFHGQAADNAGVFTHNGSDLTNRPKTTAMVSWNNIPAWTSVGAIVQSPDLSGIVQEIVNRSNWTTGNSLVMIIDGSGRRVAKSYESGAATAPLLHVEFIPAGSSPTSTATPTIKPTIAPTTSPSPTKPQPTQTNPPAPTAPAQTFTVDVRVSAGNNDVEQRSTDGFMYLNSSDLELINDPGVMLANQSVGMRFTGVNIPRGAYIVQAYLEFLVDEATSEATSLVLRGQAADNAAAFASTAYDVTNRAKTNASSSWSNIPAWTTLGAKVHTPDLSNIIQEIVNRAGWVTGNSLAIIADGSGRRVAQAYELNPASAALLHVVYSLTGGTITPPTPPPAGTPTATSLPPTPTRTPSSTPPPPTPTSTAMPTTIPPTSSPQPTASGQPTPVGQTGQWKMIFNDDFNSSSLDTSKWRTCFWWADTTCSIETNHELELYNSADVLVQNGSLRLRAQRRDMVAWNGVTYHYTSGMVMTGGRSGKTSPEFTFTYGYAEALIKVPSGKGLWPAFWMLPVSYNSRPEIDIMEILGDTPSQYHMNYHFPGGDAGSTWNGPNFSAGWHVIGLDWEPTALVWYVDGVERWRYTVQANISNQPEYLLLNLAVGGDWPGVPDGNTAFPSYFDVDYVRVWQR